MESYQDYIRQEKALAFDEMRAIHQDILQSLDGDEDAIELYGEVAAAAVDYAHIRAEWALWDKAKKMENDAHRTALHNKLIITFNQLARYLKMQGKETDWRDRLGYEDDDRFNRKRIGDFGCYIAFVSGINAR